MFECSAISEATPVWLQEVANSYVNDVNASQLLTELAIVSPNAQGFSLKDGVIYKKQTDMGGQ